MKQRRGLTDDQVSASITQGSLTKTGNGKYTATVTTPGKCMVNVVATMSDGTKRGMGSIEFRVKPLPSPQFKILNKSCGSISKGLLLAALQMDAVMENFDFSYQYKVIEFRVVAEKNGSYLDETIPGNKIDQTAIDFISNKLKPGDKIWFEKVKVRGTKGDVSDIYGCLFNLTN